MKPSSTTTHPPRSVEDLIPPGTHEARCIGVADLGTHETTFEGKPAGAFRFIKIMFEFPDFQIEYEKDGVKTMGPKVLSEEFKFIGGDRANYTKLLMAWFGTTDKDCFDLAGEPASVTVVHKPGKEGNMWANIAKGGITPANPKYVANLAPQHNPNMNFSIEDNGFDSEEFRRQWNYTKKKIEESSEYKEYLSGPKKSEPKAIPKQEDLIDAPFK